MKSISRKRNSSPKTFSHKRLRPFRKKALLEAAFLHPSSPSAQTIGSLKGFDRLEFFGDAILNFVICRALFKLFPTADEGELSRLRSTLVSRKILAKVAGGLKLKKFLTLGKGVKNEPPQAHEKLLADAMEALIAAVYLDQGLARAEAFLLDIFAPYLDARRISRMDPNPKGTLQILSQKHWQKLPRYEIKRESGQVIVEITLDERLKVVGQAANRKDAEKKAAQAMIKEIRQELAGALKKSSERKLLKERERFAPSSS